MHDSSAVRPGDIETEAGRLRWSCGAGGSLNLRLRLRLVARAYTGPGLHFRIAGG